ncbi:MAG: imelysin family protein [Marinosulfonomonas sp.]
MKTLALVLALSLPSAAMADHSEDVVENVIQHHILPGFERLSEQADRLAEVAGRSCKADSAELRAQYQDTFDAWIAVSHLRFGPTEVDDRAFALAFWPDSRGATPKALNALIANEDPIAGSVEDYASVSIAARGFYALEFLLYDPVISTEGQDGYRCQLIQTVTADIAQNADEILDDWENGYAALLMDVDGSGLYRSEEEAAQELFKALSAGLEFTSETRLGRPMGTYDRPRPKRAENWRSGRSLRNVYVSIESLKGLAVALSDDDPELTGELVEAFDESLEQAQKLDDPIFAGVATPKGRFRVELLKNSIEQVRHVVRDELGPSLGVASGFNAMDGD